MIPEEYNDEIEEIMSRMKCLKNFQCIKSDHPSLCKVKHNKAVNYLMCLDDDSEDCSFSLLFGDKRFCQCPLRVFLSKNLGM